MCKDVGYAPADGHRSCKLAKMGGIWVLVNSTVLMPKYLEPKMYRRDSKDAICEGV